MAERISADARGVLGAATIEGFGVRLNSGELPRALYEEVNEILVRLGGRWKGGRARAHVFQEDPRPLVADVAETGEMPPKNPLAFYPTPEEVVELMVAHADLDDLFDDDWCLEPSAGRGAIADRLARGTDLVRDLGERLTVVEVNPLSARVLRSKGYREVVEGDFLKFRPARRYARVMQNAPFSVEGDPLAYVAHAMHAWSLVAEGGRLLTITPDGFLRRKDRRSVAFRRLVEEHGYYVRLGQDAFRESGACVEAVLVVIERTREMERRRMEREPHQGYLNYFCFLIDLYRNNSSEMYEEALRIYERLERGELPLTLLGGATGETERLVRDIFARCVRGLREQGAHVPEREEWTRHLVETFMEGYAEWYDERRAPARLAA